jgi:nucleotide-binding universal stress UspA family protein
MKTILVPTENIAGMRSTLETALVLAQRANGYIEGFPLRLGLREFVTVELSGSFPVESYQEQSNQEMAEARRLFEGFMTERGVKRAGVENSVSCGWLDNAPEGESFIGSYGRVFDVIVMSRPDADSTGLHNRAIESGLFESGRPVLLAPPSPPKKIATNIMIHWNGSTEQARTNAFAKPLLRQADRVTVLNVIGGQNVPGPSANQVLRQLQYSGLAAKAMNVELEGRSTGEAVLAAATAEGCDLLIKGAFTRNRLRQMIFGGATSHIMAHAELPVLMAH